MGHSPLPSHTSQTHTAILLSPTGSPGISLLASIPPPLPSTVEPQGSYLDVLCSEPFWGSALSKLPTSIQSSPGQFNPSGQPPMLFSAWNSLLLGPSSPVKLLPPLHDAAQVLLCKAFLNSSGLPYSVLCLCGSSPPISYILWPGAAFDSSHAKPSGQA